MTGANLTLIIFLVILVSIISIGLGYFICSVKTRTRLENFKIKLMKIDYEIGKAKLQTLLNSKRLDDLDGEVISFDSKEEMESFINNLKNKKGE